MDYEDGKPKQPEQISLDDELRKLARALPFSPFEIITTSGNRYEIKDTMEVAIGSATVVVVLPRTGVQMIRKNQIVAIHVAEPVT